VITERNDEGQLFYKRAFNTEACEQLNAWLGGFESILKRMSPGNFNWFLHTMLFYHTVQVLRNQSKKREVGEVIDGEAGEAGEDL
jgi:predicted GNAT superfamily acetyltransferase